MAKTTVYRSFEVREGFGSAPAGAARFTSESRAEADAELEKLNDQGSCAQLFGVKNTDHDGDGERVLLRMLVARNAA